MIPDKDTDLASSGDAKAASDALSSAERRKFGAQSVHACPERERGKRRYPRPSSPDPEACRVAATPSGQ